MPDKQPDKVVRWCDYCFDETPHNVYKRIRESDRQAGFSVKTTYKCSPCGHDRLRTVVKQAKEREAAKRGEGRGGT